MYNLSQKYFGVKKAISYQLGLSHFLRWIFALFCTTKKVAFFAIVFLILPLAPHPVGAGPLESLQASPQSPQIDPDDEIIYIDGGGAIRVIDPVQLGSKRVEWHSPESGYIDFAVGDFNNDGDYEIAGIRGVGSAGEVVVYDPVVSDTESRADGVIPIAGGVPWKRLCQHPLGFTPVIIGAGNFDSSIAGDEIIVGYISNSPIFTFETGYCDSESSDEPTWKTLFRFGSDRIWDHISVGNINDSGIDEIVVVERHVYPSRIAAFWVTESGLGQNDPFFFNETDTVHDHRAWHASTIGQVYAGGYPEVVAIRQTSIYRIDNALIFQFNPDTTNPKKSLVEYDVEDEDDLVGGIGRPNDYKPLQEEKDDGYMFAPAPVTTFLANVTGEVNGQRDDEVFFLRTHNTTNFPHLFARNQKDPADESVGVEVFPRERFELALDTDTNGYTAGTGGDIDGDGEDELIIMRNNRIRVYRTPEINMTTIFDFFVGHTNSRSLQTADLDINGMADVILISQQLVTFFVESPCETTPATTQITLEVEGPSTINYEASIPDETDEETPWVTIISNTSGQTGQPIVLNFNWEEITQRDSDFLETTLTVTTSQEEHKIPLYYLCRQSQLYQPLIFR